MATKLHTRKRPGLDVDPEPEDAWAENGDRCYAEGCAAGEGCKHCGLYRCVGCQQIRDWGDGGTDSTLCDECWGVTAEFVAETTKLVKEAFHGHR